MLIPDCTVNGVAPLLASPTLGPLQNNGGPTQTHALLTGSPAINAGNPSGCRDNLGAPIATDQRGFPRPSNGTLCDIGAYELFMVACPSNSLQAAVDSASPGIVVPISGVCNENILVRNEKQRITLDGGGTATIHGPSAASPAINVRGKGILIQNLTISGGSNAVHVNRGSNAVINNNFIENAGNNGVLVDELAFAVLTNNFIHDNPGAGIFVSENSTARIGFNADSETVASFNEIQNNGLGVVVSNGSSARIIGNDIRFHSGVGVQVLRDSQADIANNNIYSNGDGIEVGENSFVQLGEDSGASIYESANTSQSANTGFGIKCAKGGVANGRLGALTGNSGATSFDSSCINSLVP
jgi:hypothetical protein